MGLILRSKPLYEQDGYVVVEQMMANLDCWGLICAADTFPSAVNMVYAPLMQPHRTHALFYQTMCNYKIVSMSEILCGGPVSGLQSVWYYGKPGTPGFNIHQDNYFVESEDPDAFVSVWIPMQDITPEMGGLIGYPGSHQEPQLDMIPVDVPWDVSQDKNATREAVILPAGYQPHQFLMKKGDAVFMHSHFLHGSQSNVSDQFRSALLMTYIKKGTKFRPGFTAKRVEVELT